MEPHTILKLEAAFGEKASRILRQYEKKCAKRAKKTTQNYPSHEYNRQSAYNKRMEQRKQNRGIHLARAFLKGTPYKTVEQSTREGNGPDPSFVHGVLYTVGSAAELSFVKGWINGNQ